MVSHRLLIASIALLAVPVVSAAPAPSEAAPEPVEVYGCFNGGVTVVVLGEVALQCFGGVSAEADEAAAAPARVEVRQCDFWGNSVAVVYGSKEVESPCISTGCGPTCATATAAPQVSLRPCNYHPPGRQVHYGEKAVGPCILLPQPQATTATAAPEPFPLVRVGPCPEGQGSRIYLTGEDVQATECGEAPVTVDLRCNDPAYGVQAFVGGQAVTTCVPLPHGV